MKYYIGLIVGIVFLIGFQFNAFSADNKIGVFDLQKLQRDSSDVKKIGEAYSKKLEPKKKEFDREKEGLIQLEEEMRKQNMMLSLDAKEGKMKEYKKKTRRLKFLENELLQDAKDAEMDMRRSIMKKLAKIVGEVGKKDGYTIILEKGSILYSSDAIDITDKLIKAFDR